MFIKLIWIDSKDEWHMTDEKSVFIQEFFDCENIHRYFSNLDKESVNHYRVDIEKVNR